MERGVCIRGVEGSVKFVMLILPNVKDNIQPAIPRGIRISLDPCQVMSLVFEKKKVETKRKRRNNFFFKSPSPDTIVAIAV